MRSKNRASLGIIAILFMASAVAAASDAPAAPNQASSFDAVVDRISQSEARFLENMKPYHPVVETYIQNVRDDKELGAAPRSDQYFLGRLDYTSDEAKDKTMLAQPSMLRRVFGKVTDLYKLKYLPLGFAQMIFVDSREFDRAHYDFKFVRREFLGDIRCLAIDVVPKPKSGRGRFVGRIWVEDQDYNIVRFNGVFSNAARTGSYLHFDSWRMNLQPGVWLPVLVYSEESDVPISFGRQMRYKSQTRLWGYDLHRAGQQEEFTSMLVDAPDVKDTTGSGQSLSPVEARRAWERQAEDNVIARLEKAGMMAPAGEVSKVLETVVNNLEITNNLDIQPEVHVRVLLTTPLESFTIGHTIVVSRGLLDTLPDESTLAMVLSHELAHIALGHKFDTKYAFNDRMIFPDEAALRTFDFHRNAAQEQEADQKAMALLQNSPYKDKLSNAGLFLRQLEARAPQLPNLVRPHLGNALANGKNVRMAALVGSSPTLEARRLDQIASLPLGGRIKLDPWDDHVELAKPKAVPLVSTSEKMPFEVTPIFPYLTRIGAPEKARLAEKAK